MPITLWYNLSEMSTTTVNNETRFLETLGMKNAEIVPYNVQTAKEQCELVLSSKFESYYGRKINGKVLRFAAKSLVGSMIERVNNNEPHITYPFIFSLAASEGTVQDLRDDRKQSIMDEFSITSEYEYKGFMKRRGYHENKSIDLEIRKISVNIEDILNEVLC